MNNIVTSYWTEKLPNGVLHTLINTKDRWIYYRDVSDTEIVFDEDTIEVFNLQPIEKDEENFIYIRSTLQEKDQISIFWIPFPRGKRKKDIIYSKNLEL